MNSPVKPEASVVEDLQTEPDGMEYLRLLKQQSSAEVSSSPPDAAASPIPGDLSPDKERRRSPRFRCSGSAEFRVDGNDVRMWGTLTDVSLHGCYVEMANTFPVDTRVNLRLEALEIRVHVQAVVRVSYPLLGMGLCFVNVEPDQRKQVERLLLAISLHAPRPSAAAPKTSTHSLADVDLQFMLDALTEFFRTHSLLSRMEFYQIAKRARR